MQIAIQKAETLDNKPLVSIWFGDRQVVLKESEFEELKENITLFELDNKETALEVLVQEQLRVRKVISIDKCTNETSIYHTLKKFNH